MFFSASAPSFRGPGSAAGPRKVFLFPSGGAGPAGPPPLYGSWCHIGGACRCGGSTPARRVAAPPPSLSLASFSAPAAVRPLTHCRWPAIREILWINKSRPRMRGVGGACANCPLGSIRFRAQGPATKDGPGGIQPPGTLVPATFPHASPPPGRPYCCTAKGLPARWRWRAM